MPKVGGPNGCTIRSLSEMVQPAAVSSACSWADKFREYWAISLVLSPMDQALKPRSPITDVSEGLPACKRLKPSLVGLADPKCPAMSVPDRGRARKRSRLRMQVFELLTSYGANLWVYGQV